MLRLLQAIMRFTNKLAQWARQDLVRGWTRN